VNEAGRPSPGTILVTGAASGIGEAVSRAALDSGWDALLVDRNPEALDKTRMALAQHGNVVARVADVTDEAALVAAVVETRPDRRPLAGVVASAGVEILGDALSLDLADWARSLAVNLSGVFNTARAGLPELLATRGAFVAVASDAGLTGAQGYSAYCAAKHGVVGLVKAMALDYGPRGVRVNAVAPAFVETPMAERIFADDAAERGYYQGIVPLGRFARPDEIAAAVMHLVSAEASYTNGLIYRIDGGATAG
jgi:NAD(P)-dependent dehydrogenase (short-subunit alcohol dehydrogenase family)